ncbi:hypothetical protein [Caloranaerobacter ferrireducens]|uniref:hypothetical protein n=1 Tax=Caloranaerobacter ferrireducens TaxID=1323370 RepID=UPI00084E0618|nr:hypothetical protein [Caloranaerobacter ferrireducens]
MSKTVSQNQASILNEIYDNKVIKKIGRLLYLERRKADDWLSKVSDCKNVADIINLILYSIQHLDFLIKRGEMAEEELIELSINDLKALIEISNKEGYFDLVKICLESYCLIED